MSADFQPTNIREKLSARLFSLREANTLLTLRGAAVLLLAVLLLIGPVKHDFDIVASYVSYAIIGVLILLLAITLFNGFRLKRSLSISVSQRPRDEGTPRTSLMRSGRHESFVMHTSAIKVTPLFLLEISLRFENAGAAAECLRLTGWSGSDRLLVQGISFPHRGEWRVREIQFNFGDQLGFAALRWKLNSSSLACSFRVYTPEAEPRVLPVLSSASRAGDAISDVDTRQGELYDLKQYHPSDGVRRILWKKYAKTGELISRHPERAMTPEGLVVLFCVADKFDDDVCAAYHAYLKVLEEQQLEIMAGCEGMLQRNTARSARQAEELCVDSVWDCGTHDPAALKRDFSRLLNSVGSQYRIERVVVFIGVERLRCADGAQLCALLGESLAEIGAKPVFVPVFPDYSARIHDLAAQRGSPISQNGTRWRYYLHSLFVKDASAHSNYTESGLPDNLVHMCVKNGWDILEA